jgi:HPr kinase/phosphorylase
MLLHASSVARKGDAVLLLGAPGAGKSDLVLRMIDVGWRLVADDQVMLRADHGTLRASAPAALHGMLEVRGLGVLGPLPVEAPDPAVRLAVMLVPREGVPRLPEPECWSAEGVAVPAIRLHGFDAAAPARLALALEVACGRLGSTAGAFR